MRLNRRKIVTIPITVVLVIFLIFATIQMYWYFQPTNPVLPPDEWTLITVGQPDLGCEGWEQAAYVYRGTRDGVFFIRAVWNESRQNLRQILGSSDTYTGSEGVVQKNVSYYEQRYVYVQMQTPSEEYEIVVGQFPFTTAEVEFLWNLRQVYKTGDDYTVIVGVVPDTEGPEPPESVENFEILSVESGYETYSSNDFYLTGNLPPATTTPLIDGFPEDWEELTKLQILYNCTPPRPLVPQSFTLSRFGDCLSLMFALQGNYSAAYQRFPQATLNSLSQALFYASSSLRRESYSLYLHADRVDEQLDVTASLLHSWTEDSVLYSQRIDLHNSMFAVNTTFEVVLPESVWQDLVGVAADQIHVTPIVEIVYLWPLLLV